MKNLKKFVKVLFAMLFAIMLGTTQPVEAASDTVVIYEVYGGGGNSGATFKNDYVVLKNVSTQDQSLDGLYVHRASDASWYEKIALKGTIKAGEYYVIQASEGNNVNAKALPRKDIEAKNMTIAAKSFSIALTSDSKTPSLTNIIDLVGVGTAINNEGKPTKSGANNISLRRISDIDSDNNYNDFKQIFHNDSSLDYLNKSDEIDNPELEVIPEESVVTIDPNGGEISGLQESTVVKAGESYTFPWTAKYYKDGYHFDGYDVEGELLDNNGNKVTYIQSGQANPIYNFTPNSDITLKARWKVMQGGQFKAYVRREDNTTFGGQQYKLYLKGTDTDERKLPYGVTYEAQSHKMSLLQLKNDTYTLRVEGLANDEFIKEVHLNEDKYTQNQADTNIKVISEDKAEIAIKYDSHFIAPEVSFDVIIGKKPIEEAYKFTLTGEGINEQTVSGFTRNTEIKLQSVRRDGYRFLGWKVEGTLFDADGRQVNGLITNFDKSYYPGSDVIFTAVWEEILPEIAEKPKLIIYEVFGGGGKTGSVYANDYVIIQNKDDKPVSLDGMVLRKGLSNRWTDQTVKLSGEIAPGAYYVVSGANDKETDGGKRAVPAVNLADENFNLANRTFALALTTDGDLPSKENTIDLIGTGNASNFEGKQAATGRNDVSLRRINDGQDTDNNREDFVRIEHIRDTDEYPLAYLGDKDERVTVTFEFNKNIEGVEVPKTIKVKKGSTIKLPEISNKYVNDLSFMGWKLNNDSIPNADHKPGDEITVNDDITIKGIWAYNNGRVFATFHEKTYAGPSLNNQGKIDKITNLEGFGFKVTHDELNEETEGTPAKYSDSLVASNLKAGKYTFNAVVPEGYKIVRIVRARSVDNENPENAQTLENGTSITLPIPELPYNLSATENIFIEVEKDEEKPVVNPDMVGEVTLQVTDKTGLTAYDAVQKYRPVVKLVNLETGEELKPTSNSKERYNKVEFNFYPVASGKYEVVFEGYDLTIDNFNKNESVSFTDKSRLENNKVIIDVEYNKDVYPRSNNNFYEFDIVEANEVQPEVQKSKVTYLFNKDIAGVAIPEAQEVEVGSTITLPEVSPEVKDGYSFLGWSVNGSKYSTPNLKSGDQITVTEDTNVMGIWEGAYGKVSLTFHTGKFIDNSFENRGKITKLEDDQLEGAGFSVTNQQSNQITEGQKTSTKGVISIRNGLVKGTYTLNVTAPKGYEIVRIARNTGLNGVIEIDNGSTISLPRPEAPFNLTMVDSIYVEVKEKEKQPVSVTYTTNKKVTGLTLPENQELMPGTEITLPAMEKVLKAGRGLEQFEYYLINGEKKQPGDKVVINEDTKITAYYEFYNYSYTANIYLADKEGKPGTKLKNASGFVVKAGDVESVQSKNYPSNLNVGPLLPGTYDISVEIPEGYELVNILDYYNNPVTTETRPVGAESTTTSRLLKVVVREKTPQVLLPEELYIYEIYGGGGFSDTYYANDYIILQNKSNNDINLDGMYLHITDQWQNNWVNSVPLTGTIKANDYFVIQGAVSYGADHGGKYGLYQPLPRVDQAIDVNIPTEAFATAITMGPDAPTAPYTNDSANVIDLVGTYNNNKIYWQSKGSGPSLSISSRRVAYTDNNSVDFTFRYGVTPNSKINHRDYIEGKAEHKEPLWYLKDTQEEKVTVTFEHKSDADDFVLQNNQVPAEKKVWSETTIRLPEVNAEDNYNFLGWDIDGDGQADKQAGDDVKVTSNMTITGIWESLKPQKQIINFVVDPEKATATGSLFVEIDEGEDALSYAPELTVKEGYEFVKWQPSEDGLTYTAVFEEVEKPVELIRDRSIRFQVNDVLSEDNHVYVKTTQEGDEVVIEINGKEISRRQSTTTDFEAYELNNDIKIGDKVSVYIIRNNQYKSSMINKIINK